jgi:hypothetical protein
LGRQREICLCGALAKAGRVRVERRGVASHGFLQIASSIAPGSFRKLLSWFGNSSLGNGVTVAYRFLGQVVDIAEVVLQSTPILIRLCPVTSETFAKLFSLSSVLSRLVR